MKDSLSIIGGVFAGLGVLVVMIVTVALFALAAASPFILVAWIIVKALAS